MNTNIDALIADLPAGLDLCDPAQEERAMDLAIELAALAPGALDALESEWCADTDAVPLTAHLAVKLARSRAAVQALPEPAHLSVIFAVFNEHTRILTRDEHPHGEDFLRRKVRQLDRLFDGTPHTWDMTVVDDGCPSDSGGIAESIIAADGLGDRVRVRRLADAIAADEPVTRPLASPDESRKGGSVVLGMWEAAAEQRPNHVVLFTDADLSTHLGQCGLLMAPLLVDGADAAIGSRREPTSVVVKTGTRNTRGKLFIYLWKRLFPELGALVDTQCGFKAFTADTVRTVAGEMLEKQFAFDIELLLKTELRRAGAITKVPVAWIDSEAASTTTDLQPYLPMLRKMAEMSRAYLPPRDEAAAFAGFIDGLNDEAWNRLVEAVPEDIATREPHTFGDWNDVTVDELVAVARP